ICELKETGIDEYEKLLSASAAMDAVRWKEMYDKTGCKEDPHRAYEYLKDFISTRIISLDGEWLND
ncbi:MAG: hypothetical protein K5888_06755, partial [Lachnospiraceae bacterium]|nr:hypothetical protein [Lachnospiraceae bacterium]